MSAAQPLARTIALLAEYGVDSNLIPANDGLLHSGYRRIFVDDTGNVTLDADGFPVYAYREYPEGLTWEMIEAAMAEDQNAREESGP